MEIKSKEIKVIPISDIVPNPKNRNQHSEEQIERLCKIIQYQGFRTPLIISNQSGQLVAGHGRLEAAKKLGMTSLPVIYEDFENSDQEYAANVSDNSIASWSELDLAGINADLSDLGPFDIDLLGIKDFNVDPTEIDMPDIGSGEDSMIIQRTFTLSTQQSDILDQALEKAKNEEHCYDEINQNGPGNILAAMASAYVRG